MPKQPHYQLAGQWVDPNRRAFLRNAGKGLVAATAASMGLPGCNVWERSAALTSSRENPPGETVPAYRLFRAEGGHRQLGRQHGEQAAEQIHAHLDYIGRTQKISRQQLRARALEFKPLFDEHCSHLLEEIKGLSEGARISLAEALAVNIRGELKKAASEGCTTYVIGSQGTASGEVLIGQNSDMMQPNLEMGYVLHLKPKDKPQVLIWTFGGMIGYHGMNDAGVAHFANAFGGGPPGQFALPHYPVKRLMLECSTLDEILELFGRVPLASNGNYVVCDGAGAILDIEATTKGPKLLRDAGRGFLAHTNHFLCPPYATQENYDQSLADSFPRLDRMNAMIASEFGSITVERIQQFLSDHSNHAASICRHPQTSNLEAGFETAGRTVAAMISEPASRRMHVALGNPCESRFATYSMDS